MQVWRGLSEVPSDWGRSVVSIGVFDGVHRGHRAVIGRASARARELGLPLVVVTFDPHPMHILRPDIGPDLLGPATQRARLLGEAGADAVLIVPFTVELSKLPPEQFVADVLLNRLHVAAVVVGADFRFGHRAAGDVALLTEMGQSSGFMVDGLGLVGDESDRISSTRIRSQLLDGAVGAATEGLGRPYGVEGVVIEGDKRGWDLGFPTANIACPPEIVVPGDGVYAGWLVIDGERLPAAISVGSNPTFDGAGRRIEAYALDRDDLELYGRTVTVEFVARLRGMERFDSVETLKAQMAQDVARSREVLPGARR